ncbi:MAG: hypothetical protein PQJ46_01385, partial [Spirochaetales bacterium]|nr:hypothetical protein [Spirochaetales bacterium]
MKIILKICSVFIIIISLFSCMTVREENKDYQIFLTNEKSIQLLPPGCLEKPLSVQQLIHGSHG